MILDSPEQIPTIVVTISVEMKKRRGARLSWLRLGGMELTLGEVDGKHVNCVKVLAVKFTFHFGFLIYI